MKNKIFLFFTLFLLCVSLVKAGPTNPFIVYGWSYIDGQAANGMTVRLTNLDMNTPMPEIILLRLGAYFQNINDKQFLIIKLRGNYFDFVKEDDNYYYKW